MKKESIWFLEPNPEPMNAIGRENMAGTLGIQITEIGEDYIVGTMPVGPRVHQPFGILHGGASVVLAETLGSIAGMLTLNPETHNAVGLEINANHLKSVRSGIVTATARPLHVGRTTQVWEIKIRDEESALVCVSRITLAILKRRN